MIYVTENGVSEKMLCTDLCDDWRMQYFREYINEMLKGERSPTHRDTGSFSDWLNVCLCFASQRLKTAST